MLVTIFTLRDKGKDYETDKLVTPLSAKERRSPHPRRRKISSKTQLRIHPGQHPSLPRSDDHLHLPTYESSSIVQFPTRTLIAQIPRSYRGAFGLYARDFQSIRVNIACLLAWRKNHAFAKRNRQAAPKSDPHHEKKNQTGRTSTVNRRHTY